MPLSERAQDIVNETLWNQSLRTVLSRGPDYKPNNKQIAWEENLERSILDINADLQFRVMKGTSGSGVGVNPDVFREAEALKIDHKRVKRLISAANADFTWDQVVGDMMQMGMEHDAAEEVTERIALGISAHRNLEHHTRQFHKDRIETRLMIAGLFMFGLAVVIVLIYWPWFASALDAIGVAAQYCLTGSDHSVASIGVPE